MYLPLSHEQAIDIFMEVKKIDYDTADAMVEYIEDYENSIDENVPIEPYAWCGDYLIVKTKEEAEKQDLTDDDLIYTASNGLLIYSLV